MGPPSVPPNWLKRRVSKPGAESIQLGNAQAAPQSPILFPQPLVIDQQSETFFKTELVGLGGFQLSAEGIRHPVQFHGVQFLVGGLIKYIRCLLKWVPSLHELGGGLVGVTAAEIFMLRARALRLWGE